MKIKKTYIKLTPVEAARLLAENNMRVENCVFTGFNEPPHHEMSRALTGVCDQMYRDEHELFWRHCWLIKEEQVFEVGDTVKCSDGSIGKLDAIHNGRGAVTFSHTGQRDFDLSALTYVHDPIAKGHNPDKLTRTQVGVAEGWRLLEPEEIDTFRSGTKDIQKWSSYKDSWDNSMTWGGQDTRFTYRTKQPAGYFLPKPEPDPFEEWYEGETNLAGKHRMIAEFAFNAGREFERGQK